MNADEQDPPRDSVETGGDSASLAGLDSAVNGELPVPLPFHLVAIGASAGGLEALEAFFDHLPLDTDLAFVVIQHLSPDYKSLMVELLSRHTRMTVLRAEQGMLVEPNTVYLIPPKNNMTLSDGRLQLSEQIPHSGLSLPIDIFFRSIAEQCGEKSVGIVLSGTGSDGMRGVRAIKEAGGIVMVQDETQAKFDGMPRSAISTGLVDFVLPVEQMPTQLVAFVKSAPTPRLEPELQTDDEVFGRVMESLRRQTNVDFTHYKPATIVRRIERRMTVNQTPHLSDYARMLEGSAKERSSLYKELLIGVTKFFRDTAAYKTLWDKVIPSIVENTAPEEQIRVWAPACSTGEEAYSLAMLLREYCEDHGLRREIKIFATDIDKEAVEFAAAGVYPESIVADISPERLQRFFTSFKGQYQVNRSLRETVVFAYQNLIKDPPFTRMDLVSCRNVLIYLQPVLQHKVLSLLAYALKSSGYLFLGSSENIGSLGHLFQTVDSRWKIYRSVGTVRSSLVDMLEPSVTRSLVPMPVTTLRPARTVGEDSILERVNQEIVEAQSLRVVVVDDENRVLQTYGQLHDLLTLQPGRASLDLLRMVPPAIISPLRMALARAAKENREVVYADVPLLAAHEHVNLRVRPFKNTANSDRYFMVFFERMTHGMPARAETADFNAEHEASERVEHLEHELQHTKENLQATVEELETSNEELQATNEELVAANEELQSTNEELQSVNEELQTVNAEYQQKIEELTALNNDVDNILRVSDVGIMFVDDELRIRKFTPAITKVLHVLPQDVGRPLDHIASTLPDFNLVYGARQVLSGVVVNEQHVSREDGMRLIIRFLPYLVERQLRGIVIHILDVTQIRQGEERLQQILNRLPAHVAVLNRHGTITLVNRAWKQFADNNGDSGCVHTGVGASYLSACLPNADKDDLTAKQAREGIQDVLDGVRDEFYLEYPCHAPNDKRWFLMHASPMTYPFPGAVIWHLDITRRKQAEAALRDQQSSPRVKATSE